MIEFQKDIHSPSPSLTAASPQNCLTNNFGISEKGWFPKNQGFWNQISLGVEEIRLVVYSVL